MRRVGSFILLAALLESGAALGQSTIKQPGARAHYLFEAEPHLSLGLFDPPGWGAGTGVGFGFRGSVELVKNGFVPKLNNSVAIGFGADYVRYDGWEGPRGTCERFATAPSGVPVCVQASHSVDHVNYLYFPVVMQWNFWLTRQWSVFGEPGLALHLQDGQLELDPFVFFAGGRFHLGDRVTLTLRIGYPTFTFGASFLL
jgi:hypothetical protein